jgi:hypothetical protein
MRSLGEVVGKSQGEKKSWDELMGKSRREGEEHSRKKAEK